MGARAESLAKKYEAKAAELTATIQKLSDADWKKVTTAEKLSCNSGCSGRFPFAAA